ncbi:oxygen-independent coproporphyrinogen III oxidase [Jannaschia formosa]|nr:oxygen-independent coproporphyrinogen III oxidase [Jannaschia formosa]
MSQPRLSDLRALGLFDARVPRYTSYPTAAVFQPTADGAMQERELRTLDPARPVSVYVHIPFCERLCWFCACHTQGTQTLGPVEGYLDAVERELDRLRELIPAGLRMGRLHWGGGTPTILPPPLIRRLAGAVRAAFPPDDRFEFSVEIDPTMVDVARIEALAAEGMTRASIGIQDFDPEVQAAIGRLQPFETTRACVDTLRRAGVESLNMDLVYGLPHQTEARILNTVEKVLSLAPDRVALFGYAHVPWVSKRQKLIDEDTLPADEVRHALAGLAGARFRDAGLAPIGIDHFARAGDELAQAAAAGRLRRNFQGYTADDCDTLIGIGASSISKFPGGYVQNAAATAAYLQRVNEGRLAGARGHAFAGEDRLRARAIEMLMCDFAIDLDRLDAEHPGASRALESDIAGIRDRFAPAITFTGRTLAVRPGWRALTRIVAGGFDAHVSEGVRYSRAS